MMKSGNLFIKSILTNFWVQKTRVHNISFFSRFVFRWKSQLSLNFTILSGHVWTTTVNPTLTFSQACHSGCFFWLKWVQSRLHLAMQLFNLGSNSSLTNPQKVQNLWFLSKKLQNFLFHPHLCFGTKEYKRFSTVK